MGVKQGEPLSPLLFILFVNDVHSELLTKFDPDREEINGISIQQISLILLLFADDMVLFSTDPAELQLLLNKLYTYSTEWGLKVNTLKTKICIFEKRKSDIEFTWSYNGENLEVVDSFIYLGRKFTSNGSFETGIKALSDQALRTVNNLLSLSKEYILT